MKDEYPTIKDVIQEFRDDMTDRLNKIDQKQATANGRVGKLEIRSAYITGGLAIISILVIPLLVYIWNENLNAQRQIQSLTINQQEYK